MGFFVKNILPIIYNLYRGFHGDERRGYVNIIKERLFMREYLDLLQHILDNGTLKKNRTGVDTISTFNYNYCIDLRNGFPLLTTKKINWKNILFENLWFLSGNSSPDFLHKHGITFWDAWIEKNKTLDYLKDGTGLKEIETLPVAYGEYWRHYPTPLLGIGQGNFDQFKAIINGLKKDPNNRRLVLTNWHPPSAWSAKLPPCHLMAIFNVQWEDWDFINVTMKEDTKERLIAVKGTPILNLHMTQRSMDAAIGCPYNIAGYSFILSLVSHLTGIRVGYFAHSIIDAHIYHTHLEGVDTQLGRKPKKLPELIISPDLKTIKDLDALIRDGTTEQIMDTFKIENYNPASFIKFPIAV